MSRAMPKAMPETRLFAGPVDKTYAPESDHVLGAWCFAGGMLPDLEGVDAFPSEPFASPQDVVTDFKMICALANDMLDDLSVTLNKQHQVKYDQRFWRIVLMPSLIDILSLAWYRYREAQQYISCFGDAPIDVVVTSTSRQIDLQDYKDVFAATHGNPSYSAWMSAMIVEEFASSDAYQITTVPLENADKPIRDAQQSAIEKTTLQVVRDMLRSRYFAIGTLANEFSFGLKIRSIAAELMLASVLKVKPKRSVTAWPERKPYQGPTAPDDFVRIAKRIIDLSLPTSVTSRFAELDRDAKIFRFKPGRVRVLTSAFMFDDAASFEVAHAVSAGEILVAMQHGGPTGVMAAMQLSPETEFRFHRYITWGWSEHSEYDGKFLALPSPQLSEMSRVRRAPNDGIIFVSSCVRLLAGRLSFEGDIFNHNFAHREKFKFFDRLSAPLQEQISYRPYPKQPASIPDSEIISDRYPDMPFVGGNFHDSLMGARAVVMESPGSTFYQAMASNIPVIAYWSEDAFHMTADAKLIMDKFRSLGVVHTSGDDAAAMLAQVHDNIEDWWQQADIQAVRAEFCETYARVRRFWWLDWIKALWRL